MLCASVLMSTHVDTRSSLDARSTRQRWCIVTEAGPGVVGGQMLPGTAVAAPRSRSHLHAQAGGRADCRVRNRGRLLKRSGSRSGRAKGPPTLSTSLFSSPTSLRPILCPLPRRPCFTTSHACRARRSRHTRPPAPGPPVPGQAMLRLPLSPLRRGRQRAVPPPRPRRRRRGGCEPCVCLVSFSSRASRPGRLVCRSGERASASCRIIAACRQ